MATFFEIYSEYLKDPRAIQLGKKKYKALHGMIKHYYDKWDFRSPIQYREVEYEGEKIQVRDYPENFLPRMKSLIISFCEKLKTNIKAQEKLLAAKALKLQQKEQPKKKRTRKPVQKPAYSTNK